MITKVKSDYLITLAEAKAHLRVDTSAEDTYITNLIKAAVEYCENYIQKDIAVTANTLVIYDFSGQLVEVDEANLASITTVKDGSGASLTYETEIERTDCSFIIELINSQSETDLEVKFVTGYTSGTLPASIRQAILIKLADLYDVERNSYNLGTFQANNAIMSFLNFYVAIRVKNVNNRFKYPNSIY